MTNGMYGVFTLVLLGLGIVSRNRWESDPNITTCMLFWISTFTFWTFWWLYTRNRAVVLFFLGNISNAAATLSNNGFMPVAGKKLASDSVWVPLTAESNLPWLCDVLPFKSSVGDWMLLAGMIVFFVLVCRKRFARW